jgi:hypothetical protein
VSLSASTRLSWSFSAILLGCGRLAIDDRSDTGAPQTSDAEAGAVNPACDHYYDAQYSRCGGARLPPDETERIRLRFDQVCENQMALAGSGVTVASLTACTSALDASGCEFPDGPPEACDFHGSLPGGATCTDDIQCASGWCPHDVLISPEGPLSVPKCGTCAPVALIGQACGTGTPLSACEAHSLCALATPQDASVAGYQCLAITEGDLGSTCDDLGAKCKPGLYCAAQTQQCTALGQVGATCGEGASSPGYLGGCVAPLACVGLPGVATCSSGLAGSFCVSDYDCSAGLGCVPGPCGPMGCSYSGTCGPVTWVAPGQPCNAYSVRCLVGSCSLGLIGPPPQSLDGGLGWTTCPTIVADGQLCTSQACDTFSECFAAGSADSGIANEGTCGLVDSVACR